MAGYSTRSVLKDDVSQTIGASQSNVAVSKIFNLSSEDAKYLRAVIEASGVTLATAISAKLQHCHKKDGTFLDVSPAVSVSITANGEFQIEFDVSEANAKPLWPLARIVITTGAGDAVTVDNVIVTRVL